MPHKLKRIAWLLAALVVAVHGPKAAADTAAYDAMISQYVADRFKFSPLEATANGNHEHDSEIGDFSAVGHVARMRMLHQHLDQAIAFDTAGLTLQQKDDLEFLISTIKADLLSEEQLQRWKINPDLYVTTAAGSVFLLIERNFAPPAERLRSVIARERLIPDMLSESEDILEQPAAIYTHIALLQIDGNIAFFKNDLPSAFTDVADTDLLASFKQSNDGVIDALKAYKSFLKKIEKASTAPFAIGRDLYQQKLLYDEMVDLPVETILEIGTAQLHKDQEALVATAHQIDWKTPFDEVIKSIGKDHVAADQLVPTAQTQLATLRQFVIDHKILTVDGTEQPEVTETPPFMRATTFASMDPPGPLETTTKQAYYYITLPDPTWSAAKREEYLKGYNTPLLQNVSVHEVWPGHFVQYLFREHTPNLSLVRQIFSANTTVEGWAHYTEQMMIDQGLGDGDPKYRLMQYEDALLRDCRLIAGIRMHTQGMTVDEAKDLFVKQCYQQPVVGEMEAYRGTEDPTYLIYTLGKLGILRLRADYEAKMGEKFTLQDFHDRFNQAGLIPLKLIRREMIGEDGPLL